jgi:hypothetical protein
LSEAGPTTRAFVDKDNNPVNSIGGQNANGDFVAGHTATDITGVPIVIALDSSIQAVVAAMSTSNGSLASIQASATALVTASATEITLLGEIFTAAGTLATDAHLVAQTAAIGAGNTTLAAILAKQPTSPALETGNLAQIVTNTTGLATEANQAAAAGYASTTATNTTAISTASGTPADAAYAGSGNSSIIAALKGIYARLGAVVLATGANVIGAVTQSGNWVLSAGSAIIGKVGIDPANNGVVVNSGNVTVSGSVTTTPVSTASQTTNTITSVSASAASAVLITANASRKSLSFMNTGPSPVTITTANPAVFGAGYVLASGGSAGSQGGSQQYDSKVPTNAYYVICAAGLTSTVAVEEGN